MYPNDPLSQDQLTEQLGMLSKRGLIWVPQLSGLSVATVRKVAFRQYRWKLQPDARMRLTHAIDRTHELNRQIKIYLEANALPSPWEEVSE